MFERFFKNEKCVKVLCWMLSHSPGEYEAAIISYDSGVLDPQEFITVLVILTELGVAIVDESHEETLRVIINDDSEMYKKLKSLKEEFDDMIYSSSDACAAICSLDKFSSEMNLFSKDNLAEAASAMLMEVEEYENLLDDEELPEEFIRYKVLDEEGKLTEFKEFLKRFD